MNGAIKTASQSGSHLTVTGDVTLATGGITITTDSGGSAANDGNVTFNDKIDGAQTLTIDSGAGDVKLQGTVGGGSATGISGLSINTNDETGTIETVSYTHLTLTTI